MKKLIEFFANQSTFVNILSILILALGIFSLVKIQREVFPNISFDVITVTTIYPGGSAEATERLVTNSLEQALREVDGIKKMTSVSVENQSVIAIQLDPDQITAEDAKMDIQDAVDAVRDLPDDTEDPVVTVLESKRRPIIEVSLSGNVDEETLRKTAKRLERDLEAIPEVARISFDGMRDYEIRVEALPEKLRDYRVSLPEVIQALQKQNANIPGGILEASKERTQEMIIRTVGEFADIEDVSNTVIRANALAETIRVRDVARVSMGFEKKKIGFRTDGSPSLNLTVIKKEKADAIRAVDRVRQVIETAKPQLAQGVEIDFINDTSYFVRRRLSVLSSNLMVGLMLVLIVLSAFMPWRVAMVTAIGIPFSFLGAIAIFHFGDVSLNLISMMGLIIVAGMLVDDAVVVTENAQAHMDEGLSPAQAAIKGTQEVWAPVAASVMTTVMAFAPMMFMTGIFGKFIKYIPVGVILALLVSLVECFFILPHHIGAWIKDPKALHNKDKGVFARLWNNYMLPAYAAVLQVTLRFRYGVALATLIFFVGSVVFAAKKMDLILFPPGAIEAFFIRIEAPIGTPLERTEELVKPIEDYVSTMPRTDVQNFTTRIGQQGDASNGEGRKQGNEYAQMIVYLTPETDRDRDALEIIEDIRSNVGTPPGLVKVTYERQAGGPPVGKPVSIGARGDEYDAIMPAVEAIKAELVKVDGVFDIVDNFIQGKEELRVRANSAEAGAAGLSMRDIGTSIRAAYEGIVATNVRTLEEEIAVRVTTAPSSRQSERTLDDMQIANPRGNLIPLARIASVERGRGIATYEHESNQRQVRVSAEIDTSKTNSREVNNLMREKIPALQKRFPNVSFFFGGEDADTRESMQTLVEAFGFAFFGILLMLVMLFKNLYQPFIVAMTIPLGVVSVVWAFYFHQRPLSFLAIVGIIALAGVVVNNAIVLVDFVNNARQRGVDARNSIIDSAKRRLRPIFLTTLTTSVGILPTAYGIGGLDPFVVPIALALGWGVLAGAVLTSIIVPAILGITDDLIGLMQKVKGMFGKKAA